MFAIILIVLRTALMRLVKVESDTMRPFHTSAISSSLVTTGHGGSDRSVGQTLAAALRAVQSPARALVVLDQVYDQKRQIAQRPPFEPPLLVPFASDNQAHIKPTQRINQGLGKVFLADV